MQEWRKRNPEKSAAANNRHRERYPEYHRERQRRYRMENPDYDKRWRTENHDKVLEYRKRTRANNPNYNRIKIHRRDARKRSLQNDFTTAQWLRCLEYFNYCCVACGSQLRDLFGDVEPNADHWIPLASPKCAGTTATNMLCLCNKCNNNKRARDAEEWLVDRFGKRRAKAILQKIETYFQWVRERDK